MIRRKFYDYITSCDIEMLLFFAKNELSEEEIIELLVDNHYSLHPLLIEKEEYNWIVESKKESYRRKIEFYSDDELMMLLEEEVTEESLIYTFLNINVHRQEGILENI
ncbi:MAG: hypothetical protein PSX81_09440 [bacterium]|nr:hypothetical protein [bacterium]